MSHRRYAATFNRSLTGALLLTAAAVVVPSRAEAAGGTVSQSSGPSSSFYASLPTNVNTNVPAGGSFDASGCSITLPASVLNAMVPGEVYWGRCTSGLYTTASSSAPATTWFAPAPGGYAQAVHTSSKHISWKLAQRAVHLAHLVDLFR